MIHAALATLAIIVRSVLEFARGYWELHRMQKAMEKATRHIEIVGHSEYITAEIAKWLNLEIDAWKGLEEA